jgi:peptide deformylase
MTVDPSKLTIVHYPAAVLKTRAKPIEKIDQNVRAVAERMIELMNAEEGLGLAAPQVGLPWRMFVTRDAADHDSSHVFINPRLRVSDNEGVIHEEGCLSLPGIRADILRPKGIELIATDLDGREFTVTSSEFIARVWQHEHDHLNGVLIIDKMAPMDRLATRKTLKELEAAAKPAKAPAGHNLAPALTSKEKSIRGAGR